MPTTVSLLSVLLLAAASPRPDPSRADQDPAPAPSAPAPRDQDPDATGAKGHLVLVVQGHARTLHITHAVAKPSDWAGTPKGLRSRYALRILDRKGRVLTTVPLDLSRFDTRPEHRGHGRRVRGCEVRDTDIALLVNAPRLPGAARYEFVHDGRRIGLSSQGDLERMLGGGR